ncbi:MAG: hypothetical protein MZV70_15160 [Desulfobacterales bacterium]|nr:hypothetical protein [Desulfobacterales bacterium]
MIRNQTRRLFSEGLRLNERHHPERRAAAGPSRWSSSDRDVISFARYEFAFLFPGSLYDMLPAAIDDRRTSPSEPGRCE